LTLSHDIQSKGARASLVNRLTSTLAKSASTSHPQCLGNGKSRKGTLPGHEPLSVGHPTVQISSAILVGNQHCRWYGGVGVLQTTSNICINNSPIIKFNPSLANLPPHSPAPLDNHDRSPTAARTDDQHRASREHDIVGPYNCGTS
jgi:hypothetical protein